MSPRDSSNPRRKAVQAACALGRRAGCSTLSQDRVQFAHTGNSSGSASGSTTRGIAGSMQAAQIYGQHLPGSSYPSAEPETREQLLERIRFLNEQIGSLEALEERPNPPPGNSLRTFGVTNTRNPFDSVGKSGKPAITADKSFRHRPTYGPIGRGGLRQLVQSSEADNSYAPTSNSFGAIGQQRNPPGNGGGSGSQNSQP
ncbi:uncharacterized protein LY79DRAFT_569123 [Colletotrichum navitas]|uniref:Uncharacterized protein n=1 Tax=Colletotrichum navitas TaxID=681940 RepID=A0AAD8PMX1_9PEZI|nr:uncharacterized protein LY79DRAFT_569123 [Colletotrichum navitas]KAK1573115.1 hypothetical protein LY79DRAFT_569123 [Colletotrichum navitas]